MQQPTLNAAPTSICNAWCTVSDDSVQSEIMLTCTVAEACALLSAHQFQVYDHMGLTTSLFMMVCCPASPLLKLSLLSDSWTGRPVLYDSSHAVAMTDTFSASHFETEIFSLPDTQTSPWLTTHCPPQLLMPRVLLQFCGRSQKYGSSK